QREEVAGGTQLTVIESGFDRIPLARRAEAFRMNDAGWTEQLENIGRYVAV
ncbi:MAG: vanillate O-demethylase oxidoreductase VanB, partial [Chloroflexi bacterium]